MFEVMEEQIIFYVNYKMHFIIYVKNYTIVAYYKLISTNLQLNYG